MGRSQTIETRTVECVRCGATMEVAHLSDQPLSLTFHQVDQAQPVITALAYVCSSGCTREVLERVKEMG